MAADAIVPIIVLEQPSANISAGRNLAIERAEGQVIVVTDAGTRAEPEWLERLVAPLVAGGADVAAGFFVPRLGTTWERALAAATLPDAGEIDGRRFMPSSRSVAFRREWFDLGVRYPEWLDYCEDLIWDMAMQRAGAHFAFVPDARVEFAVRSSLAGFATQYYRYARGDGKAGLFARRHMLRYATYAFLAAVVGRRRPIELLVALVLGAGYVRRPVRRLFQRDRQRGLRATNSARLIPLVVALRAAGDMAKMAGYPVGLVWRWRRYGGIGWRTSWRRISPAGELFHPAASTRESRPLPASRAVESREGSR
jgi:glycosyltransferase involved in cell wall biosynthesis